MSLPAHLNFTRPKGFVILAASIALAIGGFVLYQSPFVLTTDPPAAAFTPNLPAVVFRPDPPVISPSPPIEDELSLSYITDLTQYLEDYPILPPYKDHFGEIGRRTRLLRDALVFAESGHDPSHQELMQAVNTGAIHLFPFLRQPGHPDSQTPLSDIRSSFTPGSAGIVIPVGDKNIRYVGHLLASLLRIVGTQLPIQIVYAGDNDLSKQNRDFLATLASATSKFRRSSSTFSALEFVDILTIFDDSTLRLQEGGWAIKPFAVLGSSFEKVILVDADAVFLKSPDVLLDQAAFRRSGALLFRDRLLWQNAYQERHEWYHSQIKRPSATLMKSKVWTEKYAEEADSGIVVVDKSRTDVLIGLLHICWQNSYDVREEVTYQLTYGDKETWWMGFELAGSTYESERHYGAIVGWDADFFAERREELRSDSEAENNNPSEKIAVLSSRIWMRTNSCYGSMAAS